MFSSLVVETQYGPVYFGSTALIHGEGVNIEGLRWARPQDGQALNKEEFLEECEGHIGAHSDYPQEFAETEYAAIEKWAAYQPATFSEIVDLYPLAYSTLAQAAREGRIEAEQHGKIWLTTRAAIEEAIEAGRLRPRQ